MFQIVIVAFVCFPPDIISGEYPPTTQKRKFTFLTDETTWNDAAEYCSRNYNGLLEHSSHATSEMMSEYSNGDWSSSWGVDYWLGLYIEDISSVRYGWDGSCAVANTNLYNHFEGSPPSSSDLDDEKKCAVAKKDTLEWRFEKCSINYVAICQTNLGPCTYDRDTQEGACTTLTVTSLMKSVADKDDCERYCSSINADDQANGECWAVTYISTSKLCVPSINRKPYYFDVGTSRYSAPCSEASITGLGSGSFVSWKRCFQNPNKDTTSIPSTSSSGSNDPVRHCNLVHATTTTQPPTTTTITQPPTTTTTTQPPTTTTTTQPLTTTTTTQPPTTTTTTQPPTTTTITQPPTTTTTTQPPTTTTTTQPPTTTTTTQPPTTTTTTQPPTTTTTTQPPTTTTSIQQPTTTTTTQPPTTQPPTITNTTQSATTSQSTTSVSPSASVTASCICRCTIIANVSLEEKIATLQKELTVDKTKTSLYIRKLTSAPDERASAQGIGMVLGAGVLSGVFGVILLGDITSLFRYVYKVRMHNLIASRERTMTIG